MDLARGLNASVADAERLKTLHGSVLAGVSDERDMIAVPPVGDDEREPPHLVSRAGLVSIIRPRVEEILEMVRDRLDALAVRRRSARARRADRRRQPAHRPAELAARILGRQVRIGRPLGIAGLAGGRQGAGFRGRRRAPGLSAGGASRTFRTAAARGSW